MKYCKIFLFSLLCALSTSILSAQEKIQWISWDEAIELSETQEKKLFVNIYTDWCMWCKKMEDKTFSKEYIVEYINENFYPIKFDGESKSEVHIGDNTYSFVKNNRRGYHELAYEITRGNLSYPAVVFLDENMKVIQSLNGFWTPQELEMFLIYFNEDHYRKTPWKVFKNRHLQKQAISVGNGN